MRVDMDVEQDWKNVFESLGQAREGCKLRSAARRALGDKRSATTPKRIDTVWITLDKYWLPCVIASWSIAVMFELIVGGLSEDSRSPADLGFAAARSVGFTVLCATALAACSAASKRSWRPRWAGPRECKQAQYLADNNALARQWMEQAAGRGLRCVDVEAMGWLSRTSNVLAYKEMVKAERDLEIEKERVAFNKINGPALRAADEARQIGRAACKQAESCQSKPAKRL